MQKTLTIAEHFFHVKTSQSAKNPLNPAKKKEFKIAPNLSDIIMSTFFAQNPSIILV